MGVEYVKELFTGRRGRDGIERRREYTRVFEVRTTDPNDDPTIAGGTTELPRNGDVHPGDPYAFMIAIDPVQSEEDSTLWQVTCEYSSELSEGQQREALDYDGAGSPAATPGSSSSGGFTREDDPRERPAQWSITGEQVMEVVREEAVNFPFFGGAAIVNSVGDPFDPPVMAERSYTVYTVTKNVAIDNPVLDWDTQADYRNAVNSVDFRGRAAGTLRITDLTVSSAIENGIAYAVVTLQIKERPEGWIKRVLDQGFNKLTLVDPDGLGPVSTRVRIRDEVTGTFATEPQLLDGLGDLLPVGDDPVFLEFEVYHKLDYAVLFALLGV